MRYRSSMGCCSRPVPSRLTVFLQPNRQRYRGRRPRKIDQLMPIVVEIEQIPSWYDQGVTAGPHQPVARVGFLVGGQAGLVDRRREFG